jgi:hypothetical protein
MSSMSAIFLGRGEHTPNAVGTFLHTESVQRMSLEASSTSIRRALAGRDTLEKLATLPYSVFRYIRKLALYSSLSRDMGNSLQGSAARYDQTGRGGGPRRTLRRRPWNCPFPLILARIPTLLRSLQCPRHREAADTSHLQNTR